MVGKCKPNEPFFPKLVLVSIFFYTVATEKQTSRHSHPGLEEEQDQVQEGGPQRESRWKCTEHLGTEVVFMDAAFDSC